MTLNYQETLDLSIIGEIKRFNGRHFNRRRKFYRRNLFLRQKNKSINFK